MNNEQLIASLGRYGYPLVTKPLRNIIDILQKLIDSDDPRLIEGFPVVIANWFYENKTLNTQKLLEMHGAEGVKRDKLEKLLLLTSELMKREKLYQPDDFLHLANSLKKKYGPLLSNPIVDLNGRASLSTERIRNTFQRYTSSYLKEKSKAEKDDEKQKRSFLFQFHLSTFFPTKQKEIVLKKLNDQKLTKTELEYFSRTIKKKLEALANDDLNAFAKKILKK